MTVVEDKQGRKLTLRPHPDPLLTMDVLEAAGVDVKGNPTLRVVYNQAWLDMATAVCYVSEIDGVPEPLPTHLGQIRALVAKLGHDGYVAVRDAIRSEISDINQDTAKN